MRLQLSQRMPNDSAYFPGSCGSRWQWCVTCDTTVFATASLKSTFKFVLQIMLKLQVRFFSCINCICLKNYVADLSLSL
jgi:hypothetical protein